ncbi:hypothetical protein JCM14076_21120 [Methylosoma difficile]
MCVAHKQHGISLIEILIGMLVGVIITGGAVSVFNNSLKSSTNNIRVTRLSQDLRAIMDMMIRDLRRAGYVSSDPNLNDNNGDTLNDALINNPFAAMAVENGGTCIVYAYNRDYADDNGSSSPSGKETTPVVDNRERLGFKLDDTAIKMRNSSPALSCASGGTGWQTVTDPDIEITDLRFSLIVQTLNITSMMTDSNHDGVKDGDDNGNAACDAGEACNTCNQGASPRPACLNIRKVIISLSGRTADDHNIAQNLTDEVRIRNDEFVP